MKLFAGFAFLTAAVFAQKYNTEPDAALLPSFSYPRLIQTEEGIVPMSEDEVIELKLKRIGFMDVTDTIAIENSFAADHFETIPLPTGRSIKNPAKFFDLIDKNGITDFISKFSSFHNRYYKSSYGVDSADWLKATLEALASTAHPSLKVTVASINHERWPQPSIIARIEPVEGTDGQLTIISAHQDSTAGRGSASARAPGADDNASGSSVIFNAFNILTQSGYFKPTTPIEFHWYAAEEAGLLGSQAVALSRRRTAQKIYGVLHFDMTGYSNNKKVVGITTDFTDPELTAYLREIVQRYTNLTPIDSKCGYACSDHASWHKNGYRAAFPMETLFNESNPHIHTSSDTLDKLSVDHMVEFVKMALAYAIEMTDGEFIQEPKEASIAQRNVLATSLLPGIPAYSFPRLIQTEQMAKWIINEKEFEALAASGVGFMDITYTDDLERALPPVPFIPMKNIPNLEERLAAFPKSPKAFESFIKSRPEANAFFEHFTAFHTRHFRSETGVEAALFMSQLCEAIKEHTQKDVQITCTTVEHSGFSQPSVILRIDPSEGSTGPLTIISSHLDSTAGSPDKRSPGADDNGSGSYVTLVTALILTIADEEWLPQTPIEFHWYAGEEGGLLGSQEIALARRRSAQAVQAVLHFDMTGFVGIEKTIALVRDNTNDELTALVKEILDSNEDGYTTVDTKCGYACSDHASWHKNGYRAAFPFESTFDSLNPYIHTENDVYEHLSEEHMGHFIRLGYIFASLMTTDGKEGVDNHLFKLRFDEVIAK